MNKIKTKKNNTVAEQLIDNVNSKIILNNLKEICKNSYSRSSYRKIKKIYKLIIILYHGKYSGYRVCNTDYHNLLHTEEVFLASIRLLDGYNLSNDKIPEDLAVDLLIASLFHDTGYIQEKWDKEGTGAKYTNTHVDRSIDFLKSNYKNFNINSDNVLVISKIIKATEFSSNFKSIDYNSENEKKCGAILGTADLLGQMANRAYLERLIFLYYEFREAAVPGYETEFDVLRKTIGFYEFTKNRLTDSFFAVFKYARAHFKEKYSLNCNLYMEAIDRHIEYLYTIIEDDSTNFRHKLKRGDWIQADNTESEVNN